MMGWLPIASIATLLTLSAPPAVIPDPQQTPADQPAITDAAPIGDTIALTPRRERLTVKVLLGVHGPHEFLIDTGAQRTSISRELATSLGLIAGPNVRLTSMSGTTSVATVHVPLIQLSSQTRARDIVAPALDAINLGAAGLLGVDALEGQRVVIDLDANEMLVLPSEKRRSRPAAPDEIVVEARSVAGQLILTNASYESGRVRVIIDTGTTISVGNDALRRRVERHRAASGKVLMTSVTGGKVLADFAIVDTMQLDSMTFSSLPIAFSDVAPFKRLGLDDKPALLLGMDMISQFRKVEIDFANREVRFLLPRGGARRTGAY